MAFEWYKVYGGYIEKICPDYNKSLDILVKNILEGTKRIKELGCGTGNLTKLMAEKLHSTEIIAYDNDVNQLIKAEEKLREYEDVTLKQKDVLDLGYNKGDVIVSSLLFHLLPGKKRYTLFQKLCDSKVKEIYIFDRLKSKTEAEEKKYQEFFRENLIKNELPRDLIDELVKENKTNDPDTLSEQREFFSQRGYSLDILFKNPNHGFMVYKIYKKKEK